MCFVYAYFAALVLTNIIIKMKKIFIIILSLTTINAVNAQETPQKENKKTAKKNRTELSVAPKRLTVPRPSDHVLIQFGSDSWTNKPDSAKTNGGRHFNFYIMTDKPFKTNPRFSVAYGLGIGSSNIYFDNTFEIKGTAAERLNFSSRADGNRFNKFKLTEIFLELPVELRYTLNPENSAKSWKFAVGAKVGTLLKAYTKGKDLKNSAGVSIFAPSYIEKEFSKQFLNSTRLSLAGRVGYGNFSLNVGYTLTPVAKAGFAAKDFNTLSIGLTVSGL